MELQIERREDGIVILTLSREAARNALSSTLVASLRATMEDLAYDSSARVIIITGAGERAFCAGADLKERRTMSPDQVRRAVPAIQGCFDAVASAPKPVIAAINGFALGGGLELALACDLRVAAKNATLGLPETRLAIIPGAGGTQRLPRLVGLAKAKELIFTGKRLSAEEALQIGLVSEVVDASELMNSAVNLASQMLDAGPVALAQAKFALDEGYGLPLKAGLAVETKAYQVTIPTSDRVEALEAFREKRKPVFRGE